MFFENVLSLVTVTTFGNGFGEASLSYEWIYRFISWLVTFAGDLGLGIILFTLALKLVTLPLDIISRASMKKNSLKMELMKDDLEKLQKQYANNKELYQQKMMALYKKNGYSAFSACLPTIITLVFFFIVLAGFQSFSRYYEKEVFNEMGKAYTAKVLEISDSGVIIKDPSSDKNYNININAVLKSSGYAEKFYGYTEEQNIREDIYSIDLSSFISDTAFLSEYSLTDYFTTDYYNYENSELRANVNADVQNAIVKLLSADKISELKTKELIEEKDGKYEIIDLNKFYAEIKDLSAAEYFKQSGENYIIDFEKVLNDYADIKTLFETEANKTVSEKSIENICNKYVETNIKTPARAAAKDAYIEYRSHSAITPWIENLWVVDSPFSRAIPTYAEFKTHMQNKSENIGTLEEADYNEITYDLDDRKQTGFGKGNGLFILVAISILSMFASTILSQKMQKTQMQLSTVDGANGTAASSQKMMTWMMPIMFGIFAFMYSAAFSLYMITSTLLSTGSTLLINMFVERGFKNKIEKELAEKENQRRYGKRR